MKFQPDVCNGYHDVLMMSIILSDIAILNINDADYCCIISGISKSVKIIKSVNYKNYKKFKVYIKMVKKIINFWDTENEKQKFRKGKRPISINNSDINEIVVSNTVSFSKKGFKHVIGYNDGKSVLQR